MLGLFKYRIKEIYLILAFLFDHFFDPLYLRMIQLLIISIILIFKILTVWQFESRREKKKKKRGANLCVGIKHGEVADDNRNRKSDG